jgi:hypothetical protein
MSQVILNVSGHHQALNAYHLHPHKWPKNPPSAADQIRSAADKKKTINSAPKIKLRQISAPLSLG